MGIIPKAYCLYVGRITVWTSNRGAKIISRKNQMSMGFQAALPCGNLGVQRTNSSRNAKKPYKTGLKMGQNACPKGVARKNVSRIVLRTSRESV
jgi:hypothetical protein